MDADETPEWRGPFTEYGPRGEPTGAEYVRCSGCGVEVLAGATEHATHRATASTSRLRTGRLGLHVTASFSFLVAYVSIQTRIIASGSTSGPNVDPVPLDRYFPIYPNY